MNNKNEGGPDDDKAMNADKNFFEHIASAGPALVAIVSGHDHKLSFVNLSFSRQLGYTMQDIAAGTVKFKDIIEERQLPRFRSQLDDADKNDDAQLSYVIYKIKDNNGNWKPYFLYVAPVKNIGADNTFYLSMHPDLSNDNVPFTSSETRDLFFDLFKDEDFGTFEWLIAPDKVYWSDSIYKIYEVDDKSTEITYQLVSQFVHPSDHERVSKATQDAIQERKSLSIEYKMLTAKQNVKIVKAVARTVWDDAGNPVKFLGSIRDVTQQRIIEEDLKNKVEQLHHSNRELEEFAYVASHDMQEPLRKITTFSGRLAEKYKDALTGDGAMYLTRMIASADNMRNLINDLLEFSRISKTEQPFAPTDFNSILRQVKMDLELTIEETGTKIEANSLPVADAIGSQIKQMFTNIISNAIKFRKAGISSVIAILSGIATEEELLRHDLPLGKPYYKISITDNGIGFEDEYALRIFQVFQRLHGKSEYPGSGIGLAICKKIMEHHNGVIFAENIPAPGRTLYINNTPETINKVTGFMNARHTNERILIIDDDEDDFIITGDYIKSIPENSFTIEWCKNYNEGLKHLLAHAYDLYFVDYRLGAKSGVDFLKEARQHNCEEPIVLLTGKGNYYVDIQAMEFGAVDYLVKTELTIEKMERCIRYALERADTLKALKANERKYRNIFENSKDIVFVTDADLNFKDVNPAIENLLGYTKDEVLKMNLCDLIEQAQHKKFLQQSLQHHQEVNDWELVLDTKDGEKKSCTISVTLEDDDKNDGYAQGIIHDITNLKKVEKATLQGEKLAAAGRLVRTIAHEVRNPLNNITLSIEQMQQDIKDDGAALYMNIIQRNSKRISDLISELLNTSRPSENTLERHTFQHILDDVIAASIDRITLKHIKLQVKFPDEAVDIMADREKLKLALLNIVINAIEAMEEQAGQLSIILEKADDGVVLTITDNGCGISEENISRLFEPYFTQKRNGFGLGLTFTLNILQAHKANIDVKSQLGKGTVFTITFPVAE